MASQHLVNMGSWRGSIVRSQRLHSGTEGPELAELTPKLINELEDMWQTRRFLPDREQTCAMLSNRILIISFTDAA